MIAQGQQDIRRRARGVDVFDRFQPQFLNQLAALVERMNMAVDVGQVGYLSTGDAQQMMVHPLKMLGDDVKAGIRQQVMNVGDPPGDGILNRDHR